MRILTLVLALSLAAGCDSSGFSDRERAELRSGEAQIALGETATLDGVPIRFDAVVTDSRCPVDVECIWAGEAIVALTLGDRRAELRVVDPEVAPEAGVHVGDVVAFAVGLAPYPRADRPSDARPVVAVSTVPADG